MKRLAPAYLYRLRMLDGRPRYYKPEGTMKRLERRRLVAPTGRQHPDDDRIEYAITEVGRRTLQQSGSDPGPEEGEA